MEKILLYLPIANTILIIVVLWFVWYIRKYFGVKILEDVKYTYSKKVKAEEIARLIALSRKYGGEEKNYLSDAELAEYYYELTKLSLELTLWIPDRKLVDAINRYTKNPNSAEDLRMIFKDMRNLIQNNLTREQEVPDVQVWNLKS